MRVLVTGGAGYIGAFTVRALVAAGHYVVVVDNFSAGHRYAVPAEFIREGDLGDIDRLDQIMLGERIEAVIHFAASCYVGESVVHPAQYYRNNLLNSLNLLEVMRKQAINKIVFSSTCATYGIPERIPIDEDCPQNPVNPYGNTKLAFERMLRDYCSAYHLSAVALRYFNASGADHSGQLGENHHPETHLIPLAIYAAQGRIPELSVFGDDYETPDGTCVRDYIHVEDLAQAHLLALQSNLKGFHAYNVGVGQGYSVKEVLQCVEKISGHKVPRVLASRRAGDPPRLIAQALKIRQELGWSPKYTELESIVETAWKWHSTHQPRREH